MAPSTTSTNQHDTDLDLPTGIITFLFTDIEGSTELWRDRPGEMAVELARHDEISRRVLAAHGGYVFGVGGDGFFAAFSSPQAAYDAALAIQSELSSGDVISVRIGLHTGEATHRDGAFFGLEVNRTARIATCAHGGQLVVSSQTAALLPRGELRPLGTFELRGFEGTTELSQHGAAEFPPLRTSGQAIGNVTAGRDRLIGREHDLAELTSSIGDHRLVTLVGLGGVGKTRLAIECAYAMRAQFGDGVWISSLASLAAGSAVAGQVVASLDLRVAQGTVDEELLDRWMTTKDALLIIDNCEHVIDNASALVDRLLSTPSNARIVATSQVPLGVRGEQVLHLEPLAATGLESGSGALFAERAKRVSADLDPEASQADIEDICARLDHMPLAIELAASLASAMTPAEISRRLDERFRLLRSRDRTATERHRTLAAALHWSFDLLTPTEQVVLRRLATFAAPFTERQAAAVVADDDIDSWAVFDALLELVDRSLVVADASAEETRYHLLESVKAFGRVQLDECDETSDLRGRFTATMHELVIRAGSQLLGPRDAVAEASLLQEWPNIQAALQHAADDLESPRFEQMYAALGPIWNQHGRTSEGALLAARLLERVNIDPAERAPALFPAIGAVSSNEAGAGEDLIAEAERLWRDHGTEPPVVGFAVRAMNTHLAGDDVQGCALAAEALEMCRGIEDFTWNRNQAVVMALAILSLAEPDLAVFREVFEYESNLTPGDHLWRSVNVRASASRVVDRLDLGDPIAYVAETARLQMEAGFRHAAAHTFEALGVQHLTAGNTVEGAEAVLQAVELTLSDGPAYLWVRLLHVTAVLLQENPTDAARVVGYSREFHARRGDGRSEYQKAADGFFDTVLEESCGDDYPLLIAEGAALDVDEVLDLSLRALRAIIATSR